MPIPTARNRKMGRLLSSVLALSAVVAAALGATAYIAPSEPLDLRVEETPSLQAKAEQMIRERRLTAEFTEQEIEALLKSELSNRRMLNEYTEIIGAAFRLNGNELTADTNIRLWNTVEAGLTHRIELSWEPPELVARHVSSAVKDVQLPSGIVSFGTFRIPLALGERVPVGVKNVVFEGSAIFIELEPRVPW